MVRTCFVEGCDSTGKSTFKFPDTPKRRDKWKKYINRPNAKITKFSSVCIDHFDPQFIIKSDIYKTNGKVIEVPRGKPSLSPGACPTPVSPILSDPHFKQLVNKRKDPDERDNDIRFRELKKVRESHLAAIEANKIRSFEEFKNELPYKNIYPFTAVYRDSYIVFFKLEDVDFNSVPAAKTFFKICDNLDVKVFKDNGLVPVRKYKQILGDNVKCDKWSIFSSIISHLGTNESTKIENRIEIFVESMAEIIKTENDLDDDIKVKLTFLTEQLNLAFKEVPRYSPVMLKWAAALFYAYPGAYQTLRASKNLTIPHPGHLRRILGKLGNNSPGLTDSNVAFLKEKFKLLGADDKIVSLLLDEIYVNSAIKYKAGKIWGMAEENGKPTDCTAGTLQSFMYSSLKSKNKDIVSLVPVRSLDGDMLEKLTRQVLKVLYDIGYTVLSLIADDNAVNKKMYENLCGGQLKEWIPHPFDASKRLYLLFDTVHLFKNIRNNWINSPTQVFKLPPVPDFGQFMQDYRDSSKSILSDPSIPTEPEEFIASGIVDNQLCIAECSNSTIASSVSDDHPPKNAEIDLSGLEELEHLWLLENTEEFENDPFDVECKENVNPNSVKEKDPYIEAKFSDIKTLFFAESRMLLKLGPKLSRKAVFPSKIDRQNVSLVMKVFNDFTIVALEMLKKEGSMVVSEGAIIFLSWVVQWWKVVNVKSPFKGTRLNDRWCQPIFGPNDEKLKFLNDFLVFLKKWQQLKTGEDIKGKLTPQTHLALSHTISAQISLCKYIFETYGWDYVLLGKLMTDLIEARFGGYRRLSGCNYHVSVEQVLESERKLRILGVLKLKAASVGEFSISSFCEKVEANSKDEEDENIDPLKGAIYEKENVPLPLNSKRVLLVLSSYTATKVIQVFKREKRPLCHGCAEVLVTENQLEVERPAELYEYLSGIDRGGLNKPSAFSFDLCTNIYKLFETLVSPAYESKFLKLKYHRKAIVTLGMTMCNIALENTQRVCRACNTCVEKVIKIFLTTMANILLNNYTKKVNDVNSSRQIAAKLSKQNALKEKNTNKMDTKKLGKKKDVDARKVLKLSSNESY